jgi:hypothetical protein
MGTKEVPVEGIAQSLLAVSKVRDTAMEALRRIRAGEATRLLIRLQKEPPFGTCLDVGINVAEHDVMYMTLRREMERTYLSLIESCNEQIKALTDKMTEALTKPR